MALTVGVELVDSWEPVEVAAQPTRLVGIFGVQLQLRVTQSNSSLRASALAPGPTWHLPTPLAQGAREDIPPIVCRVPIIGPGTTGPVRELQGAVVNCEDMGKAVWAV